MESVSNEAYTKALKILSQLIEKVESQATELGMNNMKISTIKRKLREAQIKVEDAISFVNARPRNM